MKRKILNKLKSLSSKRREASREERQELRKAKRDKFGLRPNASK